ncbi:hypothetical protein ACWDSJ_22795 [Nocardia sp. NPDC003482]
MRTDNTTGPRDDVLPAEAPKAYYGLEVNVGARQFSTLTREHLGYWLTKLRFVAGGPFMTVARTGQPGFIQTYRNDANDYSLEVHTGADDGRYLVTTVGDLDLVAQLIWDWLAEDRTRIDGIDWERCAL